MVTGQKLMSTVQQLWLRVAETGFLIYANPNEVHQDGFDPTNPSVQKSMRSLLSELNDLLSTTYQLDVNGLSNKRISYVRVPRTKSDRSFWNLKEWIDTAIQISGSKHGGTFESAYRITNHIIRYYNDSFLAACETQRIQVKNCFSDHDFGRFTQNLPRQECSKSLVNGRIPKIQRHSVKVDALNYPILVYLVPRAFTQPQLMSRNQGHRNEFV